MSYKSIFSQVMRDYEAARDNAHILLEARTEQVYKTLPEIKNIDALLAKMGANLARLAIAGDTAGMENARQEMRNLQANRLFLLEENFDKHYLTAVYRCNICQDTGYIHGQTRCKCLNQRLIDEYYSLSNMKEVLQEENFDTFDLRLFDTAIIPTEGLSPHANMQTIYRLATSFVANFNEFSNLLLYGEPGTGKTFVSHAIAKDLLDSGRTVLYQTAPRLSRVLEDYRFSRDRLSNPDEMLAAVDNVDLLILDDLGAEISTVVTSAAIFDIVNQRLLARKHTVISTNLSPAQLEAQYSERLVSRFFGNYQMIKFFGEDIRVKKKYGGLRM